MTEVIQLAPDGLERLFADSMPKQLVLRPKAAHIAVLMHKAGRDAVAIGAHIDAPASAVSAFLRRLTESERKETERRDREAQTAAEEAAARDVLVQQRGESQVTARVLSPTYATPSPETWPTEDVALTGLQRAAIRAMRTAGRSLEGLAKAFRTRPDQIRRICREEAP
jgi:hypothetical protein